MESALTKTPPSFCASASANADLPLAVGPAMRMACNERPLLAARLIGGRAAIAGTDSAPIAHLRRRLLTLIQPFRALRPAPGRAAEILAPPYDVLSSAEARKPAKGKPWGFPPISKPGT